MLPSSSATCMLRPPLSHMILQTKILFLTTLLTLLFCRRVITPTDQVQDQMGIFDIMKRLVAWKSIVMAPGYSSTTLVVQTKLSSLMTVSYLKDQLGFYSIKQPTLLPYRTHFIASFMP